MKIDRRTASEDAVYSCVTKNAIGVSEIESKSLSELNFEACPSSASLGLVIEVKKFQHSIFFQSYNWYRCDCNCVDGRWHCHLFLEEIILFPELHRKKS